MKPAPESTCRSISTASGVLLTTATVGRPLMPHPVWHVVRQPGGPGKPLVVEPLACRLGRPDGRRLSGDRDDQSASS